MPQQLTVRQPESYLETACANVGDVRLSQRGGLEFALGYKTASGDDTGTSHVVLLVAAASTDFLRVRKEARVASELLATRRPVNDVVGTRQARAWTANYVETSASVYGATLAFGWVEPTDLTEAGRGVGVTGLVRFLMPPDLLSHLDRLLAGEQDALERQLTAWYPFVPASGTP